MRRGGARRTSALQTANAVARNKDLLQKGGVVNDAMKSASNMYKTVYTL